MLPRGQQQHLMIVAGNLELIARPIAQILAGWSARGRGRSSNVKQLFQVRLRESQLQSRTLHHRLQEGVLRQQP